VTSTAITQVSPTSGPVGATVTITGVSLDRSPTVKFNGTTAVVITASPTVLWTLVPAGATTGPITVTTLDGSATSSSFTVTASAPILSSFQPDHGVRGDTITLNGANLSTTQHVRFLGADAASFHVVNDTQVTAVIPNGLNPGTGTISIVTQGGSVTSGGFQIVQAAPGIVDFMPPRGNPGDAVTIHGTRFVNVQTVQIAGLDATFTVVSETQINTHVPDAAQPSSMPIRVTTPDGTAMSSTNFIVNGATPTVETFEPTSGLPGDPIVIHGTNYIGVSAVQFNGLSANRYTVDSDTQITAEVPSNGRSGVIKVTTTVGGDGTSADSFTVLGTFTATTGTLNHGRANHTATLITTGANAGKVLLAGGTASDSSPLDSAELYDPAQDNFTDTGSLNVARGFHTATALPDGTILIVGGGTSNSSVDSAEIYDPNQGTFTLVTASMGSARRQHTANSLSNGLVLIAGGLTGATTSLASAELFNPADGTFSPTSGDMAYARSGHTATTLEDGRVLIAGGPGTAPSTAGTTAELYTPNGGFSAAINFPGSPPEARQRHTAVRLNNGNVLIGGGGIGNTALLYDPSSGFSSFNATGNSGMSAAVVLLHNGRALWIGGTVNPATTRIHNPLNNDVLFSGQMPAGRNSHTATHLNNGKVLVAGGQPGVAFNTAALYDYGAGP
jgi:hypothetical protein